MPFGQNKRIVLSPSELEFRMSTKVNLEYLLQITTIIPPEPNLRQELIAELNEKLPAILKRYQEEENESSTSHSSLQFATQLRLLQERIYQNFIQTNNPDLISSLLKNKLSPIDSASIEQLISPNDRPEKTIKAIRMIQSQWRSLKRKELHQKIFIRPPLTFQALLPELNKLDKRIKKIIFELTAEQAIISHQVHHWTTLSNLKGILRSGSFYGNKILKEKAMFFNKNALASSDVKNGDEKIICFCPFLVDYFALSSKVAQDSNYKLILRPELVRLTINLNRVALSGTFNQFFKITDLCAPQFHNELLITPYLSVLISKAYGYSEMEFLFKYNNKEASVTLKPHEYIFYGSLAAINQFCLIKVYELINKIYDQPFKEELLNYLALIPDERLKKIFVSIGQGMTIFSEYNFNSALGLSPGLITELYFAEKNLLVSCERLNPVQLQELLSDPAEKSRLYPSERPSIPFVELSEENDLDLLLYGNTMMTRFRALELKTIVRDLPSDLFNTYYETRPNNIKTLPPLAARLFIFNKLFKKPLASKSSPKPLLSQQEMKVEKSGLATLSKFSQRVEPSSLRKKSEPEHYCGFKPGFLLNPKGK